MLRRLFLKAAAFMPFGFIAARGNPGIPPCLKPPTGMDAVVWARSWLEHVRLNPSIATDEGTMVAWFANAIMAGYDEAARKFNPHDAEWFAYDPECGFETFQSEDKALDYARDCIESYQDADGWPEEVQGICVGKVVHDVRREDVVTKGMLDENGCYNGRHYESPERERFDYWCEYRIG